MASAAGTFIPDWPGLPTNVGVLSTLRSGGVSRAPYDDGVGGGGFNLGTHVGDDLAAVAQNRARLRSLLPAEPAWLTQVHGTDVLNADAVQDAPSADACFAIRPGAACVIMTADCLPVLLCDAQGRVVGAAHAGWRGLAADVLAKTVAAMRAVGADDILAWLGPAIGPGSFEVGEEVKQAFVAADAGAAAAFVPNLKVPGKFFADIYHLARLALRRQGVEDIAGGDYCTVTERESFYSHRRDGVTGRMASLIWLEA